MSAFEVTITPNRSRNRRSEMHQPTIVSMAPFSMKSIVQFEDVPLTKTARRVLCIMNPSDEDIKVQVTKSIPVEHNLTIDWTEKIIPAQDEVKMEMIWTPQMDIACKETLQLKDNRNFRKDVMVILKSRIDKPMKQTRKFPTISSSFTTSHVRTMRLKSPGNSIKHKRNIGVGSAAQMQQRQRQDRLKTSEATSATATTTTAMTTKIARNSFKASSRDKGEISSSYTIVKTDNQTLQISPLSEMNLANQRQSAAAAAAAKIPQTNLNVSSPLLNNTTDDIPKENISPLTPNNVLDFIDNLNFTPATATATQTKDNLTHTLDNLAYLPTPINTTQISNVSSSITAEAAEDRQQLRPRKLTVEDLCDDGCVETPAAAANLIPTIHIEGFDVVATPNHQSTPNVSGIVTNKTFDVKRSEDISFSNDSSFVNYSATGTGTGGTAAAAAVIVNQTTTILCTPMGRTLTIIQEEDDSSQSISEEGQSQKDIQNVNVIVKRDIKLVGTPLRKHSESMQDLSWKSPQGKLAIQGSMPNLNEMDSIRSIEQNRYFHQSSGTSGTQNHRESSVSPSQGTPFKKNRSAAAESDRKICSNLRVPSNSDLNFNKNEILAQSSLFNLNEIGMSKLKKSPQNSNFCGGGNLSKTPSISSCASSKMGSLKKLNSNDNAAMRPSQKRSLHDLSSSDTPSTESLTQDDSNRLRVTNKHCLPISPPKRQRIDNVSAGGSNHSFLRPNSAANTSNSRKNWSRTQPKKFTKLTKTLSLVQKSTTPTKTREQECIKLYDTDFYLQTHINPDPFAATTTCDPFLTSTMYLDERAVEAHQIDFRKWLNALVAIPKDLDADSNTKIDVGKLFNEVRNMDLTLAPSKEEQSLNYLTTFRLESLRRAAVELFFSEEMRIPCTKVAVYVNKKSLSIRNDRNLHLDVVMQRQILNLLLCFNPLWLRLGLEVVYGEKIRLQSNQDIVGLTSFILNRLFRDKYLEQKYSKAYSLSDEYAEHIKKFTLQKILFLLLFLDKAKSKKIIKHNPCLFVKKSPYKETKEILLRISSELLANVGDITRYLRRLGYLLEHKQNYIDEFDYAFNNLAVDLRDGVRLTRVMEIILLREDLTQQLRVPAISRLQRLFNVKLALNALSEADFQLNGDIQPGDIVDGHREKTLSLLWQIIYKFRSPKFHAAARTIQMWWKRNWLRVVIRRRLRQKELQRTMIAAIKIQAIFRGFKARQFVRVHKEERIRAAIVLQKYARRYLVQKHLADQTHAAIVIQRAYRAYILGRHYRQSFLQLRLTVVFIQRLFRRRLLSRKLILLAGEAKRQREQKKHAAAAHIQSYWRAWCQTKSLRSQFVCLRKNVILLQQRYRARKQMQKERLAYLQLRQAAQFTQRTFKSKQLMRRQRKSYLDMRSIVIKLQRRRRAQLQMRAERAAYLRKREIVIKLQRRIRATLAMKRHRHVYEMQKYAACILQRRYRARISMKLQFEHYQKVRDSIIIIQRKWRATMLSRRIRVDFIAIQYFAIVLQQKYRARKLMRCERARYLELRTSAIIIQRRYRAKCQMLQVRTEYEAKRNAALTLQQRFRAYKQMRFQRAKYQGCRAAVLCLQQHIRGFLLTKRLRGDYLKLKMATICLQRAWRAKCAMRLDRLRYEQLRAAAITIQRRFRAKLEMQKQMLEYNNERQLIIAIQRRWRSKLLAREIRKDYNAQRAAIIRVQQRFKSLQLMRAERKNYIEIRQKIVSIQRVYRSYRLMQCERKQFLEKRDAAFRIQEWYRSILLMREQKRHYDRMRSSVIIIQQKWRATITARQQKCEFIELKMKIIRIQRFYRTYKIMQHNRSEFLEKRNAALCIQRWYRSILRMRKQKRHYERMRNSIIIVQRKWRATIAAHQQRAEFIEIKKKIIFIQQKFRGRRLMERERKVFKLLHENVLNFQAHARGYLARRRYEALLTPEMIELQRRKRAAKIIQRVYRGYRIRKRFRDTALSQIRKKIIALKTTSRTIDSLRNKLTNSVEILRGRYNTSDVLQELYRLDRLSRTVPHLILPHTDFISAFCYGIMAQAIRSVIDKIMIELCSRIILNLARCNKVSVNIFQKNGLVTIAQMLLRWCDKDGEIFNTLCTLIWIFSHCPKKTKIIRDFMSTPEAIYMLRETKKLVARKEKMKLNDRRLISIGPQRQQFSMRSLPSLQPDYGIIHNKPYTFISSVFAFDTILCALGIEIW